MSMFRTPATAPTKPTDLKVTPIKPREDCKLIDSMLLPNGTIIVIEHNTKEKKLEVRDVTQEEILFSIPDTLVISNQSFSRVLSLKSLGSNRYFGVIEPKQKNSGQLYVVDRKKEYLPNNYDRKTRLDLAILDHFLA